MNNNITLLILLTVIAVSVFYVSTSKKSSYRYPINRWKKSKKSSKPKISRPYQTYSSRYSFPVSTPSLSSRYPNLFQNYSTRSYRPSSVYSSYPNLFSSSRSYNPSSQSSRTYSPSLISSLSQQSQPQQGLPLGPAVGNPYGTGVVQSSAVAPLQMQYRSIYTPRPNSTISGQTQRAQHLAPGGAGHTGWTYSRSP